MGDTEGLAWLCTAAATLFGFAQLSSRRDIDCERARERKEWADREARWAKELTWTRDELGRMQKAEWKANENAGYYVARQILGALMGGLKGDGDVRLGYTAEEKLGPAVKELEGYVRKLQASERKLLEISKDFDAFMRGRTGVEAKAAELREAVLSLPKKETKPWRS